jgi:hypothetical protein
VGDAPCHARFTRFPLEMTTGAQTNGTSMVPGAWYSRCWCLSSSSPSSCGSSDGALCLSRSASRPLRCSPVRSGPVFIAPSTRAAATKPNVGRSSRADFAAKSAIGQGRAPAPRRRAHMYAPLLPPGRSRRMSTSSIAHNHVQCSRCGNCVGVVAEHRIVCASCGSDFIRQFRFRGRAGAGASRTHGGDSRTIGKTFYEASRTVARQHRADAEVRERRDEALERTNKHLARLSAEP